jgi:hypothetical protein
VEKIDESATLGASMCIRHGLFLSGGADTFE